MCCNSWGHKQLDTTEWLNWNWNWKELLVCILYFANEKIKENACLLSSINM